MPPPVHRRLLDGWIEPFDLFTGISADHAFWLDAGVDARAGWSWMGIGEPCAEPDPQVAETGAAPSSDAAADDASGPFSGGWVGWWDYDSAAERAGAAARRGAGRARGLWLRVDRVVAFDHASRRVWAIAPAPEIHAFAGEVDAWRAAAATPAPSDASAEPPARLAAAARVEPEAYAALIDRCRAAIRRGDAYQLCLTTGFSVESAAPIDPLMVFRRLRAVASSHHAGLIRSGGRALISASPERFLQFSRGSVRTSPIKGTRPRGTDAATDRALEVELRDSPKERAENVMIVDLMRNDLQRVCEPGTVSVERLLEVESYTTVHQLVSSVTGRLRRGIRLSDVLRAALPAGSMTGAPKLSAMDILSDLEVSPRGVYAGCFGWIGPGGAGDLAMVIRSIVVDGASATVGAGGGITWHSDADAEVDEVALKARAPLAALGAELPPRWRERVR
ncbi:MAG: anthranilate synthase component I family protein [Microbacterium arborescens]